MDKCPVCGYDERRATSKQHNIMNQYVNEKNPKDVAIFNSTEETLTVKDIVYKRVSNSSGNIKESKTPVTPVVKTETPAPSAPVIPSTNPPAATK